MADKSYTMHGRDSDILNNVLHKAGGMGRYQKLILVMMIPFGCTYAFVYFVQMFIVLTPQNYWCRVPELAHLDIELRQNLSSPREVSGDWNQCRTFDTNWTEVLITLTPPSDKTPTIPCQHGWEFDWSDIPYQTVVSERLWVCEHASYVPVAQAMFFAGSIAGCFIFGYIADRFGRIPAITATNVIGGIGGIATTFTTGFWDFVFCRFITGLCFDNCYMILYILFLEYVNPQYRSLLNNVALACSYTVGGMVLPWIAYFVADWRKLLWFTSLPMFLILLAPWLLPESVSWLLSKGKTSKALSTLKKFKSVNGIKISDDVLEECSLFTSKGGLVKENASLFSLRKSPPLLKVMCYLMILYMGTGSMSDGLIRISGSFGMNFFTVFSFHAATEFLAIMVVGIILEKFGRRNVTGVSIVITGVALVVALCLPEGLPQASLVVVARFFIGIGFTSTLQWSAEILPTPLRASTSSVLHLSLFLSAILSSFIAYSARFWNLVPLIMYILMAILTAGITLLLPETKNLPMTQTLADAEKIIRELSFFRKPQM